MKNLLVLAMLAMLCIGCGETDTPLTPEPEQSLPEPEQNSPAPAPLPAPEQDNKVILQLVSNHVFWENKWTPEAEREHHFILPNETRKMVNMIVPVGTPTEAWVVIQGGLVKLEMIFQKEIYQFIWCFLDDRLVLVNILDNQIPYVSDEAESKHLAEKNAEWNRIQDELGDNDTLIQAKLSNKPFFIHETTEAPDGDKIEVVIKHTFTYNYFVWGKEAQKRDMIFVEVLRNITRPHITFPQPLLP